MTQTKQKTYAVEATANVVYLAYVKADSVEEAHQKAVEGKLENPWEAIDENNFHIDKRFITEEAEANG